MSKFLKTLIASSCACLICAGTMAAAITTSAVETSGSSLVGVATPDEVTSEGLSFKSLPTKTDYLIGTEANFSFSDEDIESILGTGDIVIQDITSEKLFELLKKANFNVDFDMDGAELVFTEDGQSTPVNIEDCTIELVDPPTVDVFAEAEGYDSVDEFFEDKKAEIDFVVDLIKKMDESYFNDADDTSSVITSLSDMTIDDSVAALIEGPYTVNVKYNDSVAQFRINLVSDGGFEPEPIEDIDDEYEEGLDVATGDEIPDTSGGGEKIDNKPATFDSAPTTKPATITGGTTGSNSVKTGQSVALIIGAVSLLFVCGWAGFLGITIMDISFPFFDN